MGLEVKKYSDVHTKTGSEKLALKQKFDDGHLNILLDLADQDINPEFGALLYQIQQMQDDITEVRRYLTQEVGDGAKGDTGPQGPQGPQGPRGQDGADGKDGVIDVSKLDMSKVDVSRINMALLDASTLPLKRPNKTGFLYNDRGIIRIS
tara:strand:+ start:10485 stop:10934 length:450 start_codon:yes stop_codon:yes gene_type:complete